MCFVFRAQEVQIIDFQTQQEKLLPNITLSYALNFTKKYMLETYTTIYETELSQGNFQSVSEVVPAQFYSLITKFG